LKHRVWMAGGVFVVVGVLAGVGGHESRSEAQALGPKIAVDLPVEELAADGTLAAATLRNAKTGCDRIIVWKVRTRRVINAYTDNCDIEGLSDLAVAGTRVAWVDRIEEGEISSSLSATLRRQLAAAGRRRGSLAGRRFAIRR
jgi:hypothetical protein